MPDILKKLHDCLLYTDETKSICIAYSGGIDSTVLLHAANIACASRGRLLKAIHIDHQIHADSNAWSQHCRHQCDELNIDIDVICVDVEQYNHLGVEGAARQARYQAFESVLGVNDLLLSAHHADDQIETMLLQLFRGAGVHGLAGCASKRALGKALLMRPLLDISRQQIEEYAQKHQLSWLDDPSNDSLVHDRNYLRLQVMPLLHSRWQGLQDTIGRSGQWQSESMQMLNDLAKLDAKDAIDKSYALDIEKIKALDNARLKNVLRWWIKSAGYLTPSAEILQRVVDDAVRSRDNCGACIRWQYNEIRKYRGLLYLQPIMIKHDVTQSYQWDLKRPLIIDSLGLTLTREQLDNFGINLCDVENLLVKFRQGGEAMRPRGRGCQKDLKKLFQEQGVKPWERDRIPLLFHQQQLIFVWGYWIGEGY
ncbi:MAG: tRNA lysidine(34) synthetase TilS [Gammaproteobacteria bacterium]|nr:tRNA lysidine(34) synthetase TilS [Gammaproteobacteria bacterium]